MKKQVCILCIMLTAVVCFDVSLTTNIQSTAKISRLLAVEDTEDALRRQKVSAELYETFCDYEKNSDYSRYEYLSSYLLTGETKQKPLEDHLKLAFLYQPERFQQIVAQEAAIWTDLKYFPVPLPRGDDSFTTSYEDSWMYERSFGGKRGHEGTDIMASHNTRGHYPIISMSDGTVEKAGWLTQGGYRIGIRTPGGSYLYYAHLYDYAREFQPGDTVAAGEFLGFMGDSGYSEVEGTVGNFDVHLHVGIYLNDKDGTEFSVNPYWVLKWLEPKRLTYQYE